LSVTLRCLYYFGEANIFPEHQHQADIPIEIKFYKLLINFYPKNIIIETFSLLLIFSIARFIKSIRIKS